MYSLDYDTMTQMLQQFKYSGEVHAVVPPQAALKSGGRVILTVFYGTITRCLLQGQVGQKPYHYTDALAIVSRLGVLEWKLASPTCPSTALDTIKTMRTAPMGTTAPLYPHHIAVSHSQMSHWSALHRSVYSLADGTRTIERIACLLARSPNVIEQIIYDLQISGVIERLP